MVAAPLSPRIFMDHGSSYGLCFQEAGLLMPYPAVDAFAQQVSVSAVAGVLFDSVNPQLPDSDPLPAQPRAQVRVPGQYRIGCRLLASKVSEGALGQRLLRSRSLEGGIT
jgi:hypothetical protein